MRNPLLKSLLGYGVELQPRFSVKQNDGREEQAFQMMMEAFVHK